MKESQKSNTEYGKSPYRPNGVVIILVLTILVTIASYFSRLRPEKSGSTLTLWHSYMGDEHEALEKLVRQFNSKNKTIQVRLLNISFDNLPQKLTNAIPRGHGPDLFIFAHDRLGDWTGKELLEPIGFWVDPDMEKMFLPEILRAFTAEKALFALPLTYKSVALYYNKRLVETPPKTTKELISLGRNLTNRRTGKYGLVYEATDIYFHAPWLFGFGGNLLKGDSCSFKPAIDSKAALDALRFARKLAGPKGIVPPEVTGQLVATLFKNGKAAMAVSGPWFLSQIGDKLRDDAPYGITILPVVSATGKRATPLLSAEGVFMSSACRDKKAAFKVMKYLTSDASSLYRLKHARQLPANKAIDGKLQSLDPLLTAFKEARKHSKLTPATPMMRMIWQPYSKALSATISRNADPKESLKEAEWEVNQTLGACLAAKSCRSEGSDK